MFRIDLSPNSRLDRCSFGARLRRWPVAWRAVVAAVCGGLALAACTPTFDWRTVHDDAGYTVDLPAKPTVEEHVIDIAGTPMTMRMRAAQVAGAVFAVGTVTLPDDREATQHAVLDYLHTGLARNLGTKPAVVAVPVPLAAGGQVAGIELRMTGTPAAVAASGPTRPPKIVIARLVARGRHVYQAVAISDTALPAEQLDQFFGSLKLD